MEAVEIQTKYAIPTALEGLFDRRPILLNESVEEFDALRASIIEMMEPENISEWLLVASLARYYWEEVRLEKMKADLVNLTWKEAVRTLMEALVPGDLADRASKALELSSLCFRPEGRKSVMTILTAHNLTEDAIAAQSAALRWPEIEGMSKQADRVCMMRMAVERELQHHRAAGSWKKAQKVLELVAGGLVPLSPSLQEPAAA